MVKLLKKTRDDICDHAKEDFPDECCGVILHTDTEEFVIRCQNIQNQKHKNDPDTYPRDAHTAYLMDPDDLIKIHRESETQNKPIKAFYHSHPDREAYFSEKDKSDAMWDEDPAHPGVAYIVISIYGDTIRDIKAFMWDNTTSDFIETPVQTVPPGANT